MGLIDLVSALILLALALQKDISLGIIIVVSSFLLLKAFPFLVKLDPASIFDALAAFLIIFGYFLNISPIFFYIPAGLLTLKGLISLL